MTPFMSLLAPIFVSAIAVFIISCIIHMAMPWHEGDYDKVKDEDGLMNAVRTFNLTPGDYVVPRPNSTADMKSPEFIAKRERGPIMIMTIAPNGPFNMPKIMGTWFAFTVVVSAIVACVVGSIVPPGGHEHSVFHHAGVITFLCYAMGAVPLSIWYYRKWSTTFKSAFDALLYGLAAGWIFSMMWPKA